MFKAGFDLGPNDYLTKIVDHTDLHNLLITEISSLQDFHSISGRVTGLDYSPDGKNATCVTKDSEKESAKTQICLSWRTGLPPFVGTF